MCFSRPTLLCMLPTPSAQLPNPNYFVESFLQHCLTLAQQAFQHAPCLSKASPRPSWRVLACPSSTGLAACECVRLLPPESGGGAREAE